MNTEEINGKRKCNKEGVEKRESGRGVRRRKYSEGKRRGNELQVL